MDRFQEMVVFAAVAEARNFASAARRLSMSPPSMTRAVTALEERLGVRLLTRTTRQVRLTDAGARFLEDCRRILADLNEAESAAVGAHGEPRGQLNVTSSLLFGRHYVTPAALEFMNQYEGVRVSGFYSNRVVNLVEEGVDVGVRIGPLLDSSLQAIRVGKIHRVICGSPHYFRTHAAPLHPRELSQHNIVWASGMTPRPEWTFKENSKIFAVQLAPRLTVNTNDSAVDAVVAGGGVTQILSYQIRPHLLTGELRTVLGEYEVDPWPIHVVHAEGRRTSAKVRAFVDFLVDRLRADPTIR
ncbi:MAG: LysR family transcriptional regulator [Rhodomicrobium sp.]|nr:LysR family transcriptional regulator [Rhodomicrobium sp.]